MFERELVVSTFLFGSARSLWVGGNSAVPCLLACTVAPTTSFTAAATGDSTNWSAGVGSGGSIGPRVDEHDGHDTVRYCAMVMGLQTCCDFNRSR